MKMSEIEEWKDIEELDRNYQISNLGRIKSKKRIIEVNYNGNLRKKTIKEKILKPRVVKKGSRIDSEQYSIRKKDFITSNLVYKYFVNSEFFDVKKYCIAHKNKNCLDNRSKNLIKVSWSDSRKIDHKKSVFTINAQTKRSKKGANAMKRKAILNKLIH